MSRRRQLWKVRISVLDEVRDKPVVVSGGEDKDVKLHTQMNIHAQQGTIHWAVNACLHVIGRVEDDTERTESRSALKLPSGVTWSRG